MNAFYLIGLVGQIGSGKSTVRKMLEQLGAYGIDADALAHVVTLRGTPTWQAIVDAFGIGILKFNGQIDRRKLGVRAFASAEALQKLESITHPAVRTLTKELLRENQKPVVVIEAIKLIEAGMHQWCDALWAVDCKTDVQIERVMRTRNLSERDARARLAAQGSFEEKRRLATVVIDNSGTLDATRTQVAKAWKTIRPETARDKSEWLLGQPRIQAPTAQPPAEPVKPAIPDWAKQTSSVRVVTKTKSATTPQPAVEPVVATPTTPPLPDWAKEGREVQVRRSRRTDLEALGIAIAKKEKRAQPLSRDEALKRFGERGYRIAIVDNRIIALAAWEAENLVASVREIWAESADDAAQALPRLFELIENEARELLCEVILLMIDRTAPDHIMAQARLSGYQMENPDTLHKLWQQAIRERIQPGDVLWGKRLREVITKPF